MTGPMELRMPTQQEKGRLFRALHQRDRAFIIPNPWDAGTARLLQALGFEALATTSAGFAFSIGKPDGGVDRDPMLAHAAALVAATDLPVSADLENGYGDDPTHVAETVRLAVGAGLAGCSIEDARAGRKDAYDLSLAVERVRAAREMRAQGTFTFADDAVTYADLNAMFA
ncbi:MAG TPA: isocitrate lyase/phosphoenolpyruvate mutase family protein [Vicinamibacterales bacterium]|nr:isocitrate lyase/phosphoenolpyruvate mutase family protein [Vicinamibacterales bacterium]